MSPYVLVTAAHNEAAYIGKTLQSVAAQTQPPLRWVIVSDASTDGTDELVRRFQADNPFACLHRLEENGGVAFGRQVRALHAGYQLLRGEHFNFVGMLDADISLETTYYESVLGRFASEPHLGIAGGWVCEPQRGAFRPRTTNSVGSVAGAIQLFRRACYEAVSGYLPLPWGGFDTVAEVMARMQGWETRAFPDLSVYHHKAGEAFRKGILRRRFLEGRMSHSLGTLPRYELLKCLKRVREKPYFLGSLVRLLAFSFSLVRGDDRLAPPEVIQFLQNEQRKRLLLTSRQ